MNLASNGYVTEEYTNSIENNNKKIKKEILNRKTVFFNETY